MRPSFPPHPHPTQQHHGHITQGHGPSSPPAPPTPLTPHPILTRMAQIAELTWISIGNYSSIILGMGAKQLHEWERGQQAFEAALRYNPLNPMTLLHLATCLHQQHQYLAAADVLQRVLSLDGGRVEALPILGHCWVMLDEPAKALPILHQALQHHSKVMGIFFYSRIRMFGLSLASFTIVNILSNWPWKPF